MQGKVLWFTGLSGAGKTTLVKELKKHFEKSDRKIIHLDGDEIREQMKKEGKL